MKFTTGSRLPTGQAGPPDLYEKPFIPDLAVGVVRAPNK